MPQRPERKQDDAGRRGFARKLWANAIMPQDTLVERYLQGRGISEYMPPTIRYLSSAKHSSTGMFLPAMIAAVQHWPDREVVAIHRTFLGPDGIGKAAVTPAKMVLGMCRGGAVRLAEVGHELMVGEGIETCLAAMQATGKPAWAALSTAGLCALDLPEKVREVIVLADGDDPGEAAARDCALRWMRQGRRVRIARPPRGLDFNDVLLGCAPGMEDGAQ